MNQHVRILREFKAIVDQPDPDWSAELYYPNDLQKWKIYLDGPSGTPYENGKFQLSVAFPKTFPFKPPVLRFVTRIFHPNIDFNGNICIAILNIRDYKPTISIRSVLKDIISILRDPAGPEDVVCPEAAFLLSPNQQRFHDKAASWTTMYAMNDEIISTGSISPNSVENDFAPEESHSDSSRSLSPNKPIWLYKPRPLEAETDGDQWKTYQKPEQLALEHAYQCGEFEIELHDKLIHFSSGLQVSMSYEVSIVKRMMPKPNNRRRKYQSLAFSRGESTRPIPIIDQCLSSSVNTCISAVINGIRCEGFSQKKHTEVEEVVRLLEEIPENDADLIGLKCIHLYTRDLFIFRILNKFLRDQDFSKVQTLGPFFKLLYSQFSKYRIEPNEAESLMVYRGTELNSYELRAFKRGTGKKSFHWLQFISASKSREVAEIYVGNALFIIRLNRLYTDGEGRAMEIPKISQFDEEMEVLLRPGVEFSIKTYEYDDKKKRYTFHLDAYI